MKRYFVISFNAFYIQPYCNHNIAFKLLQSVILKNDKKNAFLYSKPKLEGKKKHKQTKNNPTTHSWT